MIRRFAQSYKLMDTLRTDVWSLKKLSSAICGPRRLLLIPQNQSVDEIVSFIEKAISQPQASPPPIIEDTISQPKTYASVTAAGASI
jgi:hypothetical protein